MSGTVTRHVVRTVCPGSTRSNVAGELTAATAPATSSVSPTVQTTRSGTTVTYRTRGVSGPDTATVTEPATVAASRATWNSYPPAYTTDRIAAASQNDSSATGTRSRMC